MIMNGEKVRIWEEEPSLIQGIILAFVYSCRKTTSKGSQ
jgi:hypothetical protein